MKRLGSINIHNHEALVDGRRKIYDVAKELNYNESSAMRLSIIFSELTRTSYMDPAGAEVSICTTEKENCNGLEFKFTLPDNGRKLPPAESFFDIYEKRRQKDNKICIKGFKSFLNPSYTPSANVLDKIKQIVGLPSREVMFEEMSKLSRAVEQSPVTVLITDEKGHIEYVNPQFCKLTGYTPNEVIGKNPRILKSEGVLPEEFYKNLWKTITRGDIWYGEVCNKKKDGTVFWESSSISPIRNAYGQISHFVSIKVDITEKQRMMKEIESAKTMADEANKAKGDFLANMSHEIRTPMNAIIGMNLLLQKTKLTKKQKNYADKVGQAAHNLLGIINDILDFSKIEAGKLDVENVEFDLNEVFDNLANLINIKAEEKNLELLFDIAPEVPRNLVGDPLRLGQVLLNLCSNAIKFTEKGEIVISVKVNNKTVKKADIQFSVRDTGIGMTPEQQSKMFQSFSQADASTTRKFGGTGLGLSIAKKLVIMMGGDISLKSKADFGSEFSFNIVTGRHHNEIEKFRVPPEDLAGMKVLIVDDYESTRQVLQNYVEDFGFHVRAMKSGQEAVMEINKSIEIESRPYDLILMDWKMPGMNGLEAAEIIKKTPGISENLHIIMLSNYCREDIMQKADNSNLDAFMTKPVSQSQLLDTIMNIFGKTVHERSAASQLNQEIDSIDGAKNRHILLVEDNEINQEVAIGLLEETVDHVDIANNGQEAIDIIREKGEDYFDLVLMDLQMPVMDGYEATENIRNKLNFTNLPIVAMSADAMVGVQDRCIQIGMSDYLTKPINPQALFTVLRNWLKADDLVIPPETSSEKITEIEGLDASTGLTRSGGKLKTYKSILKRFCSNNENLVNELKEAIDSDNKEVSVRLAHTVKGVTGNIGAMDLSQKAAEIEHDLKEDEPDKAVEKLDDFDQNLNKVITSILNSDLMKEEAKTVTFDPEKCSSLISKLTQLLEDSDSDAIECVDELLEMERDSDLEDISDLINNFEFDDASQKLVEFIEKHNLR